MTKAQRNEVLVGLLFVAGVAFLGTYTIVLKRVDWFASTKQYLVDFEQVFGLREGDVVRVEGKEVGSVASLRLQPGGRVRAVLRVTDEVEIFREGSSVRVVPFSPLGGRVVEIDRGSSEAHERGAYTFFGHPSGVPLEQADVIEGRAEGELLQTLNKLVEDNREHVGAIVRNLEHVSLQLTRTDNVLGYLLNDAGARDRLEGISTGLTSATGRLDRILARVEAGDGVVGGLLEEGNELERDLSGAVRSGRGALERADAILTRADEGDSPLGVLVARSPETREDVRAIVHDVASITSQVASGQGTLGRLTYDERLYEGAARAFEDVAVITSRVRGGQGLLGALLEPEAGEHTRSILRHADSVVEAVDDPHAGTIGLLVHDDPLRDRISRIVEEAERMASELRASLEDAREQAPMSAFIGTVLAAF